MRGGRSTGASAERLATIHFEARPVMCLSEHWGWIGPSLCLARRERRSSQVSWDQSGERSCGWQRHIRERLVECRGRGLHGKHLPQLAEHFWEPEDSYFILFHLISWDFIRFHLLQDAAGGSVPWEGLATDREVPPAYRGPCRSSATVWGLNENVIEF